MLVGYKVSLKTEMPIKLYETVEETYEKGVTHSGSVRFLGVEIGGGGSSTTKESNGVQRLTASNAENSFEFPASNDTLSVLLAIIGTNTG